MRSMVERIALTAPHRPQLLEALALLAQLSEAMIARGLPRPILVGGAAVEYYTGSTVMTGDIDVTSPVQPELEEELLRLGFEIVASTPMDGNVDHRRMVLVEGIATDAAFASIPVEDLIADRMGQYASGTASTMMEQARILFSLHADCDHAYLEKRIREETGGDYGIEDIR